MSTAADDLAGYYYRGGLVRPPGRYRSWSRRPDGRWECCYTGDDLRSCRRYGSITLAYPQEPDDDTLPHRAVG